jgi:hypothetical protein
MNINDTPAAFEEAPARGYLDWLSSVAPGRSQKDDVDWKLIEAERLDDRRLEDLSMEVYGY